ncbi:MAG: hypothetical protein WDN03_00510 [Rhizomicrobium sp.]
METDVLRILRVRCQIGDRATYRILQFFLGWRRIIKIDTQQLAIGKPVVGFDSIDLNLNRSSVRKGAVFFAEAFSSRNRHPSGWHIFQTSSEGLRKRG